LAEYDACLQLFRHGAPRQFQHGLQLRTFGRPEVASYLL